MRKMWGIGLLMVALSAASAEPAPKPIHFRAHARVALDAQGKAEAIASDLGIEPVAASVKATTTEARGFTGRGEGIAAQAVCLLVRT